ncbi:hypothetical protein IscW_ISCW021821 [Ixodes scapularis]|uniref:Uncharacterized protein n=1 Tax=Ixodes scapularis TaxID=6945 RepID=B7Q4T5_IXOSC|nr:hypothetical protein IscW_ISCW021821 [Ixodes scapularis]|eukprot:XP_002411621.1 hypothetical protein IscW_ISCW021821 [Ixodes scapularis]
MPKNLRRPNATTAAGRTFSLFPTARFHFGLFDRALRVTRVEEVRKSLDTNTQEMLASIQKKIENASEAREAQIGALQERLRNHVSLASFFVPV